MEADEPCTTCSGEGVIWYDAADRRGEHVTVTEPCPDCRDSDDREPDELPEPRDDYEPDPQRSWL